VIRRVQLVVIGLALLLAACGGSSSSSSESPSETVPVDIPTDLAMVASLTCNQLGGSTPETAVPIITAAIPKAATSGYSSAELSGALQAECPDTMAPLVGNAEVASLFEG
jgi:ABC-type glycerol-3-phosphate transport system substrate-binding protein